MPLTSKLNSFFPVVTSTKCSLLVFQSGGINSCGGGKGSPGRAPAGASLPVPGTGDSVRNAAGRIDEATRTAKVRVVVPNPENLLRAGMFARVGFAAERAGEALAVPAEAVLEDEGRAFVFIPVEPPYFVRRPVVTGRSWGPWIEIARGLDEGDVVMSRGAFALKSDVLRSKMGAGCAD